MKRYWLALVWTATAAAQQSPTGTVSGTVTDADSKTPVSGWRRTRPARPGPGRRGSGFRRRGPIRVRLSDLRVEQHAATEQWHLVLYDLVQRVQRGRPEKWERPPFPIRHRSPRPVDRPGRSDWVQWRRAIHCSGEVSERERAGDARRLYGSPVDRSRGRSLCRQLCRGPADHEHAARELRADVSGAGRTG